MQSPMGEYISDKEAMENLARMNADNQLWTALQDFTDKYTTWKNSKWMIYPNPRQTELEEATKRYNEELQRYGQYTQWWPTGIYWDWISAWDWDAYQRYWKHRNYPTIGDYWFGWYKWRDILLWSGGYTPYDVQGTVKTAVNLLSEMRDLSGYIQQLENKQAQLYWDAGHALDDEALWDAYRNAAAETSNAKDLLRAKRAEYVRLIRTDNY